MPEPAYMSITVEGKSITKGALGKDSVGTFSKADQEDKCLIEAFEHGVKKPTDVQSVQVTGPRQHRVCKVTKLVDRVTPVLYETMCKGKQCDTVVIEFYRTEPGGVDTEPYYQVTLRESVIVDIKTYIPNCLVPENSKLGHMEDVSFSYKEIDWEHTKGKTQGNDTWG
jgi:type VI secretion system secreted protein Hcp